MQKNKPLVTVTISSYNHERFVEKTILSIVNQTYGYENIELLVIDDCSKDNTGKILKELSEKYNFTFIQNEKNKGAVINKNTLLKMAKGKYVAGCASDDYWHPEKIEKQVAIMETLGDDYALCHCDAYIIDENEKVIFYQNKGKDYTDNIMPKMLINNGIVAPSVLIKRELYDIVGYHDETIPYEDRDLWIRLGLKYKFYHLNELLVYRRQHPNNLSRNMTAWYKTFQILFEKYNEHYVKNNLVDEFHYMMFTHLSGSNFKDSVKHLFKIKDKSLLLRKSTYRAFFKLFIPKSLLFSNFGLKIKRIIKSW
jgi:glycosyltransferase involved in cell wall biosynthesis